MLPASVEHCCDESGVLTQLLQHHRAGLACGWLRRWPAPFTHPHQPFLLKSTQNPVRKKLLQHLCARSPPASQFERARKRFIHLLQAQSNIVCFEVKSLQRVQSDKRKKLDSPGPATCPATESRLATAPPLPSALSRPLLLPPSLSQRAARSLLPCIISQQVTIGSRTRGGVVSSTSCQNLRRCGVGAWKETEQPVRREPGRV